MILGNHLIWQSALIFLMVTEKLNDELTSIPAHPVTFSQPKSADDVLCISSLYATPNDACLLLNQQHLFYKIRITKQAQEVWVFLCCYHKNYSVYKHENTIIISLVIVNLFRRKTEDYMLGFGTCSDPNWNTIVHWSVRDSLKSWPEGGSGLCSAWLQLSHGCTINPVADSIREARRHLPLDSWSWHHWHGLVFASKRAVCSHVNIVLIWQQKWWIELFTSKQSFRSSKDYHASE